MNTKQTFAALLLSALLVPGASANFYEEIECSTDAVFGANSCDQCFEWGQKGFDDQVTDLSDLWVNTGDKPRLMYKEEQEDPVMKGLNGSTWSQQPSESGFWEWTDDLDALYSEPDEGYVLDPGESVTFIKSSLWKYYKLESTDAEKGENAWILVFPLVSRVLDDDGDIQDGTTHNECVLFKSAAAAPVVIPEPEQGGWETPAPKPTPTTTEMAKVETGAEAYLIVLFALILGFVYIKTRKTA